MSRDEALRRRLARTGANFPEDWEVLETSGVGPFPTRVVYQEPDGTERVWTSRRHRKGRGPRKRDEPRSYLETPWLGVWAPGNLHWWVAAGFVLGSLLFVAGAGSALWLTGLADEGLASRAADWAYFLGSLVFTAATYAQVLESINADPRPARARRRPDERFRFFAWQPRRLGYLVGVAFFVGSVLYALETALVLIGVSDGRGVAWLLSVPSLLGALLFVAGGYMQVVEVCHRPLCARPRSLSWWSASLNALGCLGFLLGAVAGLGIPGLSLPTDPTIVKASYLSGSLLFLAGSYLMFPEAFSD